MALFHILGCASLAPEVHKSTCQQEVKLYHGSLQENDSVLANSSVRGWCHENTKSNKPRGIVSGLLQAVADERNKIRISATQGVGKGGGQ